MLAALILTIQAATAVPATPPPPGPPPTPEAAALGRQIAEHGLLAALLPTMTATETEDLIKEHPKLSADEQAALRRSAAAAAAAMRTRLLGVVGDAYARQLTPDDMAALVAFQQTPAAQHYRVAEPKVIMATMQAMAGADFKRDSWAAYCAEPGRRCPAAKP